VNTQEDRFGDGLIVGMLFGGILGGLAGLYYASRSKPTLEEVQKNTEQALGDAQRTLDEKITQLNSAIESARERLSSLEGRPEEPS
jgi:gas vesicle protein